jgi:hypothetical protein
VGAEYGAASVAAAGSERFRRGAATVAAAAAAAGGPVRAGAVRPWRRGGGGGGFRWEGPGAAVPASEEGCPGSRASWVGAQFAGHAGASRRWAAEEGAARGWLGASDRASARPRNGLELGVQGWRGTSCGEGSGPEEGAAWDWGAGREVGRNEEEEKAWTPSLPFWK